MNTTSLPPCPLRVSARALSDYRDGALIASQLVETGIQSDRLVVFGD